MKNTRQRRTTFGQSDITPLAGWVFADLLLALAIIFLTSISFDTPGDGSASVNAQTQSNVSQLKLEGVDQLQSEAITFSYLKFDAARIVADIERYQASIGVKEGFKVVYAQIVGGYEPQSEGSEVGSLRATKFLIDLQQARLPYFAGAGFDITTSEFVAPDQILVRLALSDPDAKN
jgi:hypothetical protein